MPTLVHWRARGARLLDAEASPVVGLVWPFPYIPRDRVPLCPSITVIFAIIIDCLRGSTDQTPQFPAFTSRRIEKNMGSEVRQTWFQTGSGVGREGGWNFRRQHQVWRSGGCDVVLGQAGGDGEQEMGWVPKCLSSRSGCFLQGGRSPWHRLWLISAVI